MWRQFGDFKIALLTEEWHLVISGELRNVGKFPKFNHFNQNLSITKIFANLTSILVAIKVDSTFNKTLLRAGAVAPACLFENNGEQLV